MRRLKYLRIYLNTLRKMSRFHILIVVFISAFIGAEALCPPWQGGGTLNVCKNQGKTNCIGVSSSNTCINLTGGPFISGFSSGGYQCTIYSGLACSGTGITVNRSGWAKFPITPKSLRCPCI